MADHTQEAERAAFEAWMKDSCMAFYRVGESYHSNEAHNMWMAWQASRRAVAADTGVDGLPPQQSNHVMPPFAAPAGQHSAWVSVKDSLPDNVNCLATYENSRGRQFIIRAMYVNKFQIEAQGDDCDTEIDDETDTEYLREGWYELIDNWGEYSSVRVCEGVVTHWMPLPLTPDQCQPAGAAKGGNTNDEQNRAELASRGAAQGRNTSIDTGEFRELLQEYWQCMGSRGANAVTAKIIAYIDAWGAKNGR